MEICTITDRETLEARFAGIVSAEERARHAPFYEKLLEHAGSQTDPIALVMMIALALPLRDKAGEDRFSISDHIDAIAGKGDPVAITARSIMERVGSRWNEINAVSPHRKATAIPAFPQNELGLKRGTVLEARSPAITRWLGIDVGSHIQIGYDGDCVRHGEFSWDIDQLVAEITSGAWIIHGETDLSDPEFSIEFARQIERLEIVPQ
jgi:hypothetical protein